MKVVAGVLLAIVIIIAVNAVLETNKRPALKVLQGGAQPPTTGSSGKSGFGGGGGAGQGVLGGGGGSW